MQTVTKEAQAQGKTAPEEEELAIVNQRNGTSLTAEEVYLFTVRPGPAGPDLSDRVGGGTGHAL